MADLEVYLAPSEAGATVAADFILDGSIAEAAHPYTEQAAPGVFHAAYPSGLYTIRIFVNSIARDHQTFLWDGSAEITEAGAIADAVWDEPAAGHVAAGSMGLAAQAPGFDQASHHASLDTYANKSDWKDGITAAQIATEVQAGIINEGDGQQVIDAIVQAIGNESLSAVVIAAEVWGYSTRGLTEPAPAEPGLLAAAETARDHARAANMQTKPIEE